MNRNSVLFTLIVIILAVGGLLLHNYFVSANPMGHYEFTVQGIQNRTVCVFRVVQGSVVLTEQETPHCDMKFQGLYDTGNQKLLLIAWQTGSDGHWVYNLLAPRTGQFTEIGQQQSDVQDKIHLEVTPLQNGVLRIDGGMSTHVSIVKTDGTVREFSLKLFRYDYVGANSFTEVTYPSPYYLFQREWDDKGKYQVTRWAPTAEDAIRWFEVNGAIKYR